MIRIGQKFLNNRLKNNIPSVNNTDINEKINELNNMVLTLANRVLLVEKDVINLKSKKNNKDIIKNTFDKDMPLL